MPTITVNVDEGLTEQMDEHPEINWCDVTRQAIHEKLTKLELVEELTGDTDEDLDALAAKIAEHATSSTKRRSEPLIDHFR